MHPQAEEETILGHYFGECMVDLVDLVDLGRLLRATSEKSRQLFSGKSAPPDKILATHMEWIECADAFSYD